eukprot:5096446-Amphidinium_carterae.1
MQNDVKSYKLLRIAAGQSSPSARAACHYAELGLKIPKRKPRVSMKPKDCAAKQRKLRCKFLPPQRPTGARATRDGTWAEVKATL